MRKLLNSELDRKSVTEFKESEKIPLIVILDNIRSLHNIGSVFRTSDAFMVEKIYLCGITACPPNKEIHKTALGSTDSVDWGYIENTEDIINELKSAGYKIFSIEQAENSINLIEFTVEKGVKYGIVFGHEVKGVSQEVVNMSDGVIEIPQYGTKHSLNISVSAGIVIWDLFTKMRL
ncbi:MAG TPA: RNA methyltransferase [Bacteroidales bacterium]|nr:MAG: RNA methyltransferase [Bacteroidetes bacterium GWF2_33_38]OFY91898.1 MAG: RNA methyltransferase [Bacteroidetes bacterium RIFOXYA2_FULL_33_7]HBF88393.1 RNA methyltransferase [Bacteroidales bacterium]